MRDLMMHLGRRTVPALAALALLGACGDDGGDDDAASTPADTEEQAESSGDDGGASESAGGTGTGFVQIGDERFEFTIEDCIAMFGAVAGSGVGVDDPENLEVSFDFSPDDWQDRPASEGWESNGAITVRSEEPYLQWETGGEVLAGVFNLPAGIDAADLDITSYDIDEGSSTVTGEATFLELNAVMTGGGEPTDGSFELSCPPEG